MFRRELLEREKFDESFPVCEDYDLWLRIAKNSGVGYIPEKLIIKRGGHDGQLSLRYPAMDRFRIRSLQKLLSGGITGEKREMTKRELARKCGIVTGGALKRGKIITALKYYFIKYRWGEIK